MIKLSKIKTINSRIRRDPDSQATQMIQARLGQLGFKTKGGYMSKSLAAQKSKNLDKVVEAYDKIYKTEKKAQHYRQKKDIKDILADKFTDYELYAPMWEESNAQEVIDRLKKEIKEFEYLKDDEEFINNFNTYVTEIWNEFEDEKRRHRK